jgi:TolA-binding protein
MAGKFVPLVISGILLFSISVPLCLADEDAEIYKQKESICALIDAGKFSEAKAATAQMTIEFPGLEKLPDMLYWIARRYQHFDRFEDAKQIYEQIIRDFPDSPWVKKAKMGNAMTEAISLVVSGKFAEAKAVTAQMAVDFAGNPDLAEMLYWISGRFQAFDRFEDAKQICEQIIRDNPDSPWAKKAKMNSAMSEAMSLIMSGKYAEAKVATDKMASDFAGKPDLPEMLYWIAERYERAGRSEDAKRDYQRIIDLFPKNPLAKKAKLGIPRAEVTGLIVAKDFNNAGIALNHMISDFAEHPDLPETLYWLAVRYKDIGRIEDANRLEQQIVQNYANNIYASKAQAALSGQSSAESIKQDTKYEIRDANDEKAAVEVYRIARGYEEANDFGSAAKVYEQVVKDYPATIKGGNAVLDIRRLEILDKLNAGDANQAGALVDKFIADFKGRNDIYIFVSKLGEVSYNKYSLLERSGQGDSAEGRKYLVMTIKMLDIVISEIPSSDDLSYTLYIDGYCHYQLGEYQKSADIFQKLADDFPNYAGAWNALFMTAESYQGLKRTGEMSSSQADSQTMAAYTRLLKTYPNCPAAIVAQRWVDKRNSN